MNVYMTKRRVAGNWRGKRVVRKVYMTRDGREYVNAGELSATHTRMLIPLEAFGSCVHKLHEVTTDKEMREFGRYFALQYERLYGHEESFDMASLVGMGDRMIDNNSPLVAAFVKYRNDCLTSDREVAAFAMALQVFFY